MKKTLWLVAGIVGCMCAAQAGVIYSNSFDGVAGTAGKATVPEISRIASYYDASLYVEVDGNGLLQSVNSGSEVANYRVRIDPDPLMDNTSLVGARISGTIKMPATAYVAVGFHGHDANGISTSSADSGVCVKFGPTWMRLYGGYASENAVGSSSISGGDLPYTLGQVVDFEISYNFSNKTATVVVDGTTVYDNAAITHTDYTSGLTEDPELNWAQVQLYTQPTAADGGAYIDSLVVETIPVPAEAGTTVYQDDFSGVAGVATATVPEVSLAGFEQKHYQMRIDGSGRLESSNPDGHGSGYRVRLKTDPLTDDSSIEAIRCTIKMRTPTNEWVMIGFQEVDANRLVVSENNTGPVLQFNPTSVTLRGGTYGGGDSVATYPPYYSAGEDITAVLTYHVGTKTVDFSVNDFVVTNGFVLNHEFPVDTDSDPVVLWLNTQFRYQPSAADGGCCISSIQVETIAGPEPEPGYEGWAGGWGVDIGAGTNDYDEDGLLNIFEYGLGGDPTDELNQGASSEWGVVNVGGTNEFVYVHPQLSAPDSGLTYTLELSTDLVIGIWSNAGYAVMGTNVTAGELDFVTNVTGMIEDSKYIRLIIE